MSPEILQISKASALEAFNKAETSGRQLLSNLFGKKVFEIDVFERIQCWNDVYEDHGLNPATALPYPIPDNSAQAWLNNEEFLRLLFESLNEGWVADHSDHTQRKVYGLVVLVKDDSNPAGFRVTFANTNWTLTYTSVGSRLCLKSDALWQHVFTHFMPQLIIHFNK